MKFTYAKKKKKKWSDLDQRLGKQHTSAAAEAVKSLPISSTWCNLFCVCLLSAYKIY